MTEENKQKIKKTSWKFFGAMFMRTKEGEQAVSLTKVLTLGVFVFCVSGWSIEMFWSHKAMVPEMAVYTLWTLLGAKAGKDVASSFNHS